MSHDHDHDHDHDAPGDVVVLDIGGDIGALVVHLGDSPDVPELDIQPVGNPSARFHTGVHLRHVEGDHVRVAIYPEVRTGRYELLDGTGTPFAQATVQGGEVTTLDLR